MVDEAAVRAAIEAVAEPQLHRSFGELGLLRDLRIDGAQVTALVALIVPDSPTHAHIEAAVADAALAVPGVEDVVVQFVVMSDEERASAAQAIGAAGEGSTALSSATRVIAVSSGKGGVGKSSVTTNLAVALAEAGHRVGVIDADVWGFSIPKMLGAAHRPNVFEQRLLPPQRFGVAVMSMDYFVPPDQAVVWRGPMLHKALEQFLADVYWDDPDFLLIDMPPGTGDVAISISQFVPRAQAVLVTTPQITAQRVAKRAALMAQKVDQEVLGVVENMSWFTGDDGKRYPIFGEGGGQALADELGVPLLGQVPLLPAMREGADEGLPVLIAAPHSEAAEAFRTIADFVVERRPRVRTHPELVIR